MPQIKALGGAEKLLREIASSSLDAIYFKDRESRWLYANPSLERIAGKPSSELLGKTDAEIYSSPEVGRTILEHDKKVMESGRAETFEEFVDFPDGRHFFISVKSPRFDEKGNVIGILGISHDITNRKRREEHLRESEQKYKDLTETIGEFVWEVDPQGRYTYCSPQMESLWGIRPEEMIGKTPFDQMPPEAKEKDIETFKGFIIAKKPFSGVQVPYLDSKGNIVFIEISGVPFFNSRGELLGFRGVTRDITGRKKTEDALRASEARFHSLYENSLDAMLIATPDGSVCLSANAAAQRLFGMTEQEIKTVERIGMVVMDERVYAALRERDRTGRFNAELTLKRKDSSTFEGEVYSSLFKDADGTLKACTVIRDISARKKAEDALRESEQLYKNIFDNRDDGFVLVEPVYDKNNEACDIRFLQLNLAYEQQTGIKANKVEGKTAKQVAPNLEAEWISISGEVAKTGKTRRIENYNQRTNKWYDASYIPFTKGRVGILFRDVTERKNLEKQLQEKERLATIGATAGMVGHDVRNPLQAITGDVYLLRSDLSSLPESKEKESMKESLDGIEQNVQYVNKIVQDLQDYARPIVPAPREVDGETICEEVLFKNGVPENIDISYKVERKARRLVIDADILKRILTNLVSNAVQAMPEGGKLSVHVYRNGGSTIMEVSDTGRGIPEDVKAKLFTPLFTTKSKGQGFGLAVVKRMTEALGGSVTFESKVGEGTKFIVSLPPHKVRK